MNSQTKKYTKMYPAFGKLKKKNKDWTDCKNGIWTYCPEIQNDEKICIFFHPLIFSRGRGGRQIKILPKFFWKCNFIP